jgi:hypothetical protein
LFVLSVLSGIRCIFFHLRSIHLARRKRERAPIPPYIFVVIASLGMTELWPDVSLTFMTIGLLLCNFFISRQSEDHVAR